MQITNGWVHSVLGGSAEVVASPLSGDTGGGRIMEADEAKLTGDVKTAEGPPSQLGLIRDKDGKWSDWGPFSESMPFKLIEFFWRGQWI